jgi:hypothetical protein
MNEAKLRKVVAEDHRLEQVAERGREELAQHRWHWTLDESNPERMPIREYARQVARSERVIRMMVNGYASWTATGTRRGKLNDEIERAALGEEKLAATEAVAKARGISVGTARQHHADEIREVRATATERAERRGTKPTEEIEQVVEDRARVQRGVRQAESERKAAHTLRYVEMEGKIAAAKRYLSEALRVAEDVPFADEERDLISETIGELRALLNLIDMRVAGRADVDWDAELAKLSGGGS